MPELTFADFEPRHTDDLVRLWRASFEHGMGMTDPHPIEEQRAYFLREVLAKFQVRMALLDGVLAGFIAADHESVNQLFVGVAHLDQGIGRQLLDWAKRQSGGSLWLYTFARNQRAQRFYAGAGFVVVARGHEPFWQLDDIRYAWHDQAGTRDTDTPECGAGPGATAATIGARPAATPFMHETHPPSGDTPTETLVAASPIAPDDAEPALLPAAPAPEVEPAAAGAEAETGAPGAGSAAPEAEAAAPEAETTAHEAEPLAHQPEPAAPDAEPAAAAAAVTAAAPAPVPDLSPAACAARLAELFPALFAQRPQPLKLRVQADIQHRAPGIFTRRSLSGFLHRHTTTTAYLVALSQAPHRVDLDGAPAGEISDEHRQAAVAELARRRALHEERRAAENAARRAAEAQARQAHAAQDQARRERAALLRAFETSTLTRANFCALKRLAEADLEAQLALARVEATQRALEPRHEPRHDPRHDPRPNARPDARPEPRHDARREPRPEPRTEGAAPGGPRRGSGGGGGDGGRPPTRPAPTRRDK